MLAMMGNKGLGNQTIRYSGWGSGQTREGTRNEARPNVRRQSRRPWSLRRMQKSAAGSLDCRNEGPERRDEAPASQYW